jgi:hypothetical protein
MNDRQFAAPGIRGGSHTLPVHLAVATGHPADALQPQNFMDALTRQLNIQASTVAEHPDWQVEAILPGRNAADAEQGFVLVFATANLEGVRLAYTGIKQLSATPSRRFGVLFSGAPDGEFACRCQERLASGVRQFLGIHLHELGHLSAQWPDFSADLARPAVEVHRLWEMLSVHNQPEVAYT